MATEEKPAQKGKSRKGSKKAAGRNSVSRTTKKPAPRKPSRKKPEQPPRPDIRTEKNPQTPFPTSHWGKLTEDWFDASSNQMGRHFAALAKGFDMDEIGGGLMQLGQTMMQNPQSLAAQGPEFWQGYVTMWQSLLMPGMAQTQMAKNDMEKDRRFADPAWEQHPLFNTLKRSYLLTSRYMLDSVDQLSGLDDAARKRLKFFLGQLIDASSPSNFPATNPVVLRETAEQQGANLQRGLQQMLNDLSKSGDAPVISQTDFDAFEVGKNIATTPGKVIFQTDVMQLIQYNPSTDTVFKRPLLIVPPWINKYYILDLKPENSFIRWAVEQGHTVFVVSWVNPDESLKDKTLDDYMREGPLAALDAIEQATGERKVNTIGYCVGGTLMATTLAYMAATGDERIKSCTFFTTQVDFTEPGDLKVFISEDQLDALDKRMEEHGYLDGKVMAHTFNMLRSNDLIWSYVVNNYLLGKKPKAFDLLYWNADATNQPRALHNFYLREMYLKNNLARPGGITVDNVPIDLRKVRTPIFLQSAREDHIAPYPSVFKGMGIYGGPVTFMLSGSGHIAGVVNPPSANKYQYWTNPVDPPDLDEWLAGAEEHPGSWWPYWQEWVSQHTGEKVTARIPGDGKLTPLEDAPGSYVRKRI